MFIIFIGIPFGFDFVSVWIEHSYGTVETFGYRLTLDILNILAVNLKSDKQILRPTTLFKHLFF